MAKPPDLQQLPRLPDEVIQAALNGELILFVGAGVSRLVNLPSWNSLAWNALEALRKKDLLNFSELEQLKVLDAKKQLSIAQLIAEESEVDLNLPSYFAGVSEGTSIYKTINDIGCVCVTTNYDELLSPRFTEAAGEPTGAVSVKPKEPIRISEKERFLAKWLDEPGTVVHLHGAVSKPATMVVTTSDYLAHYDHRNVQHFLRDLFDRKVVLFLGYGLEEVEILEHILRRGETRRAKDRRRFALQGYFLSQDPLYRKLYSYYEQSFGVHLIGYVRDHNDYAQQEAIFREWAPQIRVRKPALAGDLEKMDEVLGRV